MVIMAYDEHWSTSSPGPVASLPWCAKVVDYAKSVVESEKIVMGLPLYGRAWQDKRLAKALRFRNVQELVAEKQSTINYAPEFGAYFEYSENVVVTVFYDDPRTILEKLRLYRARGIGSVSFWRIGQGPLQLWSSIDAATAGDLPAASSSSVQPSSDDS
jgi:spore germination protein YaaH